MYTVLYKQGIQLPHNYHYLLTNNPTTITLSIIQYNVYIQWICVISYSFLLGCIILQKIILILVVNHFNEEKLMIVIFHKVDITDIMILIM